MFERRQFGTSRRRVLFFIGGYQTKIKMYRPFYLLARLLGYRVYAYVLDSSQVIDRDIMTYVAQVQAVNADIQKTIATLPQNMPVYVMGNSLGSESALYALKQNIQIRAAALITARGSIADFIWNTPEGKGFKPIYQNNGYTFERLARELAPIEPLTHLESLAHRRLFVAYTTDDTTIPPANTKLLIDHLTTSNVKTYHRGNHIGATVMGLAAFWRWHRFFLQS